MNVNFVWKPTTGPFRHLSPGQARAYDERGYLLLEQALAPARVRALADEVDRFEALAHVERLSHEILFADEDHTSFVLRLAERSALVRELCFNPLFLDLVADLVGPDAWMHYDHSIYKKPFGSLPFFWHQDNAYPFIEPQQKCVTFWIALTDMNPENGCLWLQPGGHLAGTLVHENNDNGWICFHETPPSATAVPVRSGDVLIHSALLPHYSGPNRTPTERKAFSLSYVPDGAYTTQIVDGKSLRVTCATGVRVLTNGVAAPLSSTPV